MAEDAIALNGINGESRAHFSTRVVPIKMYRRKQENLDVPKPKFAISGIVTYSGGGFCHIIANKRFLFPKDKDDFRYDVVFPDDTTVDLDVLNVETRGDLAAFYCPIGNGIIDAVEFYNHTTENLQMYLYEIDKSGQLIKDVTNGYLTHAGQGYIAHDCTASFTAYSGAPIFNDQRQLVGISFENAGVTKALDVNSITALLSSFFEGMEDRPLPEILQHIEFVGQGLGHVLP